MADHVQVSGPAGPNGEKFELNLKERLVAISMKDLVPFLLLALVGALGYYRIITHDERLRVIDEHLQRLYTQQDTQRSELQRSLLGQFEQQREQLRSTSELITSQSEQIRAALRENREITAARMQAQDTLLHAQTDEVRKQHAVLLHRLQYPDQPVSLDLPLPHPERGR